MPLLPLLKLLAVLWDKVAHNLDHLPAHILLRHVLFHGHVVVRVVRRLQNGGARQLSTVLLHLLRHDRRLRLLHLATNVALALVVVLVDVHVGSSNERAH